MKNLQTKNQSVIPGPENQLPQQLLSPATTNTYNEDNLGTSPDSDALPAACSSGDLILSELLAADCLDADRRPGRPQKLTNEEKALLVQLVRESWETRRMSLVDIQCRARLGHAGLSTLHRALTDAGIKAYIEEFKFILSEDNMVVRYVCFSSFTGTFLILI